jgi:hypothetical protein
MVFAELTLSSGINVTRHVFDITQLKNGGQVGFVILSPSSSWAMHPNGTKVSGAAELKKVSSTRGKTWEL